MNEIAFLLYLATGALGRIIVMRYPTPGQRIGEVCGLFVGGIAAGVIIPAGDNRFLLIVAVPHVTPVISLIIARLVDRYRVRRELRKLCQPHPAQTAGR